MATTGGLILCGGRSSRMGQDKAGLRFGPATLLERALERMGEVADPLVVSLAAGAPTPPLPAGVTAIRDAEAEQGPLRGLLEGFRALQGRAEQVIVMPVDMPFFTVPWLARLIEGLRGHNACCYRWEGIVNALTAAYRLELLPKLEGLVAEGRMRPLFLSEGEATRILTVEELWRPGQGPPPLMDMDTPDAYREALLLEGYGNPAGAAVTVMIPGGTGPAPELPLRAATAGEALGWVRRLYPELAGAAGADTALGLRREGEHAPLAAQGSLAPGERLVAERGQGPGRAN